MNGFQNKLDEARRLFILETLVVAGGSANETILRDTCRSGFHAHGMTREAIREDISWLADRGCLRSSWISDGDLILASITERGQDVTRGDVLIQGIKRPPIATG